MQCIMIGVGNDILKLMTRKEACMSEHAEGGQCAMNEDVLKNGTQELVSRQNPREVGHQVNILTSVWV